MLRSTAGCQMLWLKGNQELGGEILEFKNTVQSFEIPAGADQILFVREALPYRCEVSGMGFGGDY